GDELTHHHFTIDEVLGATQTDETDFQMCVPALGEDLYLGYYCGGRRVSRYMAVETGKVPLGKSLQAFEDFGLHVAHDFGEAVDDSLFAGGDGRGDVALSCGPVFGGAGV